MGRGKQWSNTETKAIVEAFIHISEDAIIGTNQTSMQLYQRVAEEAKKRYVGDWMRSPEACRKRWIDVSREVQKFCAAMKFVESVEHSGWNEEDYFKAAEEYYCTRSNGITKFQFVDEWNFLKRYEKWKAISSSPLKRSKETSSSSDGSESDTKPSVRPIGNKKQKVLAAFESKAEEWMSKIAEASNNDENHKAMLTLMQENIEQSQKNRKFLQEVFNTQTEKLARELQKSSAMQQKSLALKTLSKLDLTTMSASFQQQAKKKIEEELSSILDF